MKQPIPNSDQIECLANCHIKLLPDSLISRMGLGFTRAFYRFAYNSSEELVLDIKNDKQIHGVAILSFSPQTLARRMLSISHIFLSFCMNFYKLPVYWLLSFFHKTAPSTYSNLNIDCPELVIIFVVQDTQNNGYGSALLRKTEQYLRQKNVGIYKVKTLLKQARVTKKFYEKNGFKNKGLVFENGEEFLVFTKKI